ncbi:MAG TPA: hypothetical protein VKA84_10170 [Gemmatimonadaceae bacterium]|nr:hypothetical protein [Gemmatimonadaceae bacterium]
MHPRFLGLDAFQWVALIASALTVLVLAESWIGHYRSGFPLRAQYAPFASGGILIAAALAAVAAPGAAWAHAGLRTSGWLAVATGVVGVGYHHYYGIVEKAGGYRWLLHYLMYGAPQLAPLALSAAGALAVVAAQGLAGRPDVLGVGLRSALFGTVTVSLAGAIAQSAILHYRGAYNNRLMYAPLTLPALAAAVSAWMTAAPGARVPHALGQTLYVLTFLTGFLGLGMHLRGFDRQMGGLHLFVFNLLQGPPPFAPATFAALAAVGLVTSELL